MLTKLISCMALLVVPLALVPSVASAADDGVSTFATYCSACHGDTGKGDGAASASLDPKPANFADPKFWAGKDDAYLTKVIKEGGPAVGKSPLMAAWGSVLSDAQVEAVVKLIKSFKGK